MICIYCGRYTSQNLESINSFSLYTLLMCELYYLSLSIPLIGLYLNSLTYFYPTKNINEIDILNRKIISINICGWNLLHTLLFYYICKAKNVKIIEEHFLIFLIGLLWFLIEGKLFNNISHKIKISTSTYIVYESINKPRIDDLLFNTFGQIIFIMLDK